MRRWTLLGAALLAALLLPAAAGAVKAPKHHRIALIAHDRVVLYTRPSSSARVLAVLVQQTQVEVLRRQASWTQVAIWASVTGWLRSGDLVFRKPWSSVSTYVAPEIHYPVRPHPSQRIGAHALTMSPLTLYRSPGHATQEALPAGRRVAVSAWQQDSAGKVWYRIGKLWALADGIEFETPDPGLVRVHGQPIWGPVSGKGMWLTLGTVTESAPEAIVHAAVANGITHLYVEAAISPLGFHGRVSAGGLLAEAHRHRVAVLAWVYPYLYDLASDVALTRTVAAFRTSSGDRFDGIAADLERNISLWDVRAYSELVRAYLGSDYLLIGVTYPPQSFPNYPFAEIARQYNLIAPMDYWHQTQTSLGLDYGHMPYGYTYGYRYAVDSVATIRRYSGHVPVAPIGQTFDNFGRLEMGPHAPSADEVVGFLAGSKTSGARGVSFFQWMTATVPEWHALGEFRF